MPDDSDKALLLIEERERLEQERIHRLESMVDSLRAEMKLQFVALAMGQTAADSDLERRLNQMNEFRAQIATERGQFVFKPEYEARHAALTLKLEEAFESSMTTHVKDVAVLTDRCSRIENRIAYVTGAGRLY